MTETGRIPILPWRYPHSRFPPNCDVHGYNPLRPLYVCAVTRRRFPVGASPTRQPLQPEATGAVMEVTKWLKPLVGVSREGDSASVQAVTRERDRQSSKSMLRAAQAGPTTLSGKAGRSLISRHPPALSGWNGDSLQAGHLRR